MYAKLAHTTRIPPAFPDVAICFACVAANCGWSRRDKAFALWMTDTVGWEEYQRSGTESAMNDVSPQFAAETMSPRTMATMLQSKNKWPATAIALSLALAGMFWVFHERELDQLRARLPEDLGSAETAVTSEFHTIIDFFLVLGNSIASDEKADAFGPQAGQFLGAKNGLSTISLLDESLAIRKTEPPPMFPSITAKALSNSEARLAAERAKMSRQPTFSKVYTRATGELGFAIFVPVFLGETFKGEIVGFLPLEGIKSDHFPKWLDNTYKISMVSGEGFSYFQEPGSPELESSLVVRGHKDLTGQDFFLKLQHYRDPVNWQTLLMIALCIGIVAGVSLSIRSLSVNVNKERELAKQMQKAKDLAEAANAAKTKFVANISHEIRTPIGAMIGYVDLMLRGDHTQSELLNDLLAVRRNGEGLLGLINDLLDLSKVEAGLLDIEMGKVNILELLASVDATILPLLGTKALSLSFTNDGPIPETFETDPNRVRQIVVNLVSNAIKFSKSGVIEVKVAYRSGVAEGQRTLKFSVQDPGIGISKAQEGRLFQTFSQGETSTARKYGGTGLGLALSRNLAAILGGTLTLEWSEVGMGSRFALVLPVQKASATMISTLAEVSSFKAHLKVEKSPKTSILHGVRILLVDDGIDNQAIFRQFLESEGAFVVSAMDGQCAIALVAEGKFDVVLMDAEMPVMNGYDAARELRKVGFTFPIIFLTANAMKGERERCLKAGGTDYLTKPVTAETLIATVRVAANWTTKEIISAPKSIGEAFQEVPHHLMQPGRSDLCNEPLVSTLSNDPRVMSVVDGFLGNLPGRIDQLTLAGTKDNWRDVAKIAHALKGTAGNYGYPDMVQIARHIEEDALRNRSTDSLNAAIGRLWTLSRRALLARKTLT